MKTKWIKIKMKLINMKLKLENTYFELSKLIWKKYYARFFYLFFVILIYFLYGKLHTKLISIIQIYFQPIILVDLPIKLECDLSLVTLHTIDSIPFWHKESQKNSYANTKEVADNQWVTPSSHNTAYLIENQLVISQM